MLKKLTSQSTKCSNIYVYNILSTYYVSGNLYIFSFNPHNRLVRVGVIIIPILEIRKLRYRGLRFQSMEERELGLFPTAEMSPT